MGRVYKALDPAIGRTVAIKTLNVDLEPAQFEEFKQRFFREARTAGRLQHPNVVTIYDVGEQDGLAYITMEYVEGKTLREIMDAESPLKVDTACRIAGEVAAGLAAAHRQSVVHRDVKPSNIMVGRERRGEADGLRHRAPAGRDAHAHRPRARVADLHRPGADRRPPDRRALRPLLARHRAVRDARRRGAVPRRRRGRAALQRAELHPRTAEPAQLARPGGVRAHLRAGAREASRRSLPDGRRVRAGLARVAERCRARRPRSSPSTARRRGGRSTGGRAKRD